MANNQLYPLLLSPSCPSHQGGALSTGADSTKAIGHTLNRPAAQDTSPIQVLTISSISQPPDYDISFAWRLHGELMKQFYRKGGKRK